MTVGTRTDERVHQRGFEGDDTPPSVRGGDPFDHALHVTTSADELAEAAVPALRRALAAGDSAFLNLAPTRQAAVRAKLGADADRVSWADAEAWTPHPARRLRAIQKLVDAELDGGAPRLWFLGECAWARAEPELVAEWERLEAVLNVVLAGRPVTMVCVYDAGELPATVVEQAVASHPLRGLEAPAPSPGYVEPAALLACDRRDRLPVPPSAVRLVGPLAPSRARAELVPLLTWCDELVEPVLVATTELVTNSWQAGAASVGVACWRDGPWVVVQVDDDGPGLVDPFAGYRRPSVDALSGRGLWITRQLADVVEIAGGGWGTSVRLRLRAGGPTADDGA